MERLEEKDRQEERRRQTIAGVKPPGGRHDLVDRIERVTKYPMALLGIAWLVIAIIVLTTDVNGSAPHSWSAPSSCSGPSCWWSTSCAWWSPPTAAATCRRGGWSRPPWWCPRSRAGTSSAWRR